MWKRRDKEEKFVSGIANCVLVSVCVYTFVFGASRIASSLAFCSLLFCSAIHHRRLIKKLSSWDFSAFVFVHFSLKLQDLHSFLHFLFSSVVGVPFVVVYRLKKKLSLWGYILCVLCVFFLMGRKPCCDKKGLKKGPWTPEEDEKLVEYINKNGHGSWRSLPKLAGFICTSIFLLSKLTSSDEILELVGC